MGTLRLAGRGLDLLPFGANLPDGGNEAGKQQQDSAR